MSIIRNLFYVLLGALLAVFIYLNFEQSVVIYYTRGRHTEEIPLSLGLFAALLMGTLLAGLMGIADQIRLRSRLRQMRRTIERLESELAALRNLPLGEAFPEKKTSDSGPLNLRPRRAIEIDEPVPEKKSPDRGEGGS